MYYQEKRTITSIVVGIALLTAYCIYVIGKVNAGAAGPEDVKFFAVTMLVFIGAAIAVEIVVQIVFHILFSVSVVVRERDQDEEGIANAVNAAVVEDERDKIIDLKSLRISVICCGIGFITGLILLAYGQSVVWMLNVMFIACSLGSIGEGVAKLIYYRAGVRNG